jgi:PleD family two-component response regulator
MGVSFYKNCTNKDELIKKADIGVYKAKNSGRDKIVYV